MTTVRTAHPRQSGRLGPGQLVEVLWDSAFRALFRAFLVLVLGRVVLGVAGSIWAQMAPSAPPGLSGAGALWSSPERLLSAWTPTFAGHPMVALWGVLFVGLAGVRLARYSDSPRVRSLAARLRHAERHVARHWFELLAGNAIGAMVSAFVICFIGNFSWTRWLWGWLLQPVFSAVGEAAAKVVGGGPAGIVGDWVAWYGNNQLQFTFWCFYLAAICDDLNLPNVKTLGRKLWRRLLARLGRAPTTQASL